MREKNHYKAILNQGENTSAYRKLQKLIINLK